MQSVIISIIVVIAALYLGSCVRKKLFPRAGEGCGSCSSSEAKKETKATQIKTLNEMAVAEAGEVQNVKGDPTISQWLWEMGFAPGAQVEVIRFAPLGDPMEVKIRGYRLALRKREASMITVKL